jgi:hypothetical protein
MRPAFRQATDLTLNLAVNAAVIYLIKNLNGLRVLTHKGYAMDTTTTVKDAKNQATSTMNNVGDKFKNTADKAMSKFEDIDVKGQLADAQEYVMSSYDATIDVVKKYPIASVLGATAVGYLAARLLRSNRH